MVVHNLKKGFTLIELVIVVAIIGILATIVYPSYTQYVIKTNRVDVQNELLQIARSLSNYKMAKGTFNGTKLENGTLTESYPSTGQANYKVDLVVANDNLTWTLNASPIANSRQVGNGDVGLNSAGQQCWTKGSPCQPSATSGWNNK